jgi:DNA-binding IclR family transcriptional regulator
MHKRRKQGETGDMTRSSRHAAEPGNSEAISGGALDRALKLLDAFDTDERAIGLAALAERSQLPKSTLLRLIGTLLARGFLRMLPDGRYQLGPAVLRLAAVYQRTFHPGDVILPVLSHLVEVSGESASLNVREGDAQVCLYRVDTPHALREHVRVGQSFPLDVGCAAVVIRAFSGESGARLEAIRMRVVVTTHGERFPGTSGIAVPVFGMSQALVGAMVLSGPTTRFSKPAVARMERALLSAGARLTSELGGNPIVYSHAGPR